LCIKQFAFYFRTVCDLTPLISPAGEFFPWMEGSFFRPLRSEALPFMFSFLSCWAIFPKSEPFFQDGWRPQEKSSFDFLRALYRFPPVVFPPKSPLFRRTCSFRMKTRRNLPPSLLTATSPFSHFFDVTTPGHRSPCRPSLRVRPCNRSPLSWRSPFFKLGEFTVGGFYLRSVASSLFFLFSLPSVFCEVPVNQGPTLFSLRFSPPPRLRRFSLLNPPWPRHRLELVIFVSIFRDCLFFLPRRAPGSVVALSIFSFGVNWPPGKGRG